MPMTLPLVVLSLAVAAQAPAGWEQTLQRSSRLMTDGKAADAIALLEPIVAKAPGFEEAQVELGRAHQARAGEFVMAGKLDDPARRKHLEQAAQVYQRIVDGKGQYRQVALGWLMWLYDEDDLNKPIERAAAARGYIAVAPQSAMGHITLAASLRATRQDAAAWAALDAACGVVQSSDEAALARGILLHLTEALPYVLPGATPSGTAPKELARLLDYVDKALTRELAADPSDRGAAVAKATAVSLRAQRLERDPARRRALEAEAEKLLGRSAEANAPNAAAAAPQPADPTPPGYYDAATKAMASVERKQYADALAIYDTFIASHPAFAPAHYQRVDVLIRSGQSALVAPALRAARKGVPATYDARHTGAVYLEEIVRKNAAISATDGNTVLSEALALNDDALAAKPNNFEALVYRSLIVRGQARFAPDAAAAQKLTAQADKLREAAVAAQKAQQQP